MFERLQYAIRAYQTYDAAIAKERYSLDYMRDVELSVDLLAPQDQGFARTYLFKGAHCATGPVTRLLHAITTHMSVIQVAMFLAITCQCNPTVITHPEFRAWCGANKEAVDRLHKARPAPTI